MDCCQPGPLPMGFSRQEYWSELPYPPPEDLPHVSYVSCIGMRVLYHWCHLGSPNSAEYGAFSLILPEWQLQYHHHNEFFYLTAVIGMAALNLGEPQVLPRCLCHVMRAGTAH